MDYAWPTEPSPSSPPCTPRAFGFGDEVIVPAYTWDGTATAVLFAGGVPVFADVDPDTYCLSVEAVRAAITPRTRAILPVHLAMRFADMDGLLVLARASTISKSSRIARMRTAENITGAARDRWATSAASVCRRAS